VKLFIATENNIFIESPNFPRPVLSAQFKRRDTPAIDVAFTANNQLVALDLNTQASFGVKARGFYEAPFWVAATTWEQLDNFTMRFLTTFNTTELNAAFTSADNPAFLEAMLEIEWRLNGSVTSTNTLPIIIHNDVIRGDEIPPVSVVDSVPSFVDLRSSNLSTFRLTVDNSGVLTVTKL